MGLRLILPALAGVLIAPVRREGRSFLGAGAVSHEQAGHRGIPSPPRE